MAVVGIDLGTTYSAVAKVNEAGTAEIVPNAKGSSFTASAVFFEYEHTVCYGDDAKSSAEVHPNQVAQFTKNHMGQSTTWQFFGKTYTPEMIAALILKKLKQDAEEYLGETVTGAVITVPAMFGEAERAATKVAAEIAGLNVLKILNEPMAAAIHYGLGRKQTSQTPQNVLVYDLGGGTFDITVMRVSENRISELHTEGERRLGGKQWDDLLIDYVAEKFRQQHRSDPKENAESLQDLRNRIEETKKTLTTREKATIVCTHNGEKLRLEITRSQFEALTEKLLERTRSIVSTVIQELVEAGKLQGWQDIHQVLLVGGSSRMPQIQRMIKELSGQEPKLHEPDLAVAKGAALCAVMEVITESERMMDRSRLEQIGVGQQAFARLGEKRVEMVSSFALGIECLMSNNDDDYTNLVIVPRNTKLPAKVTRTFYTLYENQHSITIRVLEGDADSPEDCILLGIGMVENIPPGLPEGAPIDITYELTDEALIQVTAFERTYQTKCSFKLQRQGSSEVNIPLAQAHLSRFDLQ